MRTASCFKIAAFLDEIAASYDGEQSILLDHGGHDAAGGFSLAAKDWPRFLECLKEYFSGLHLRDEETENTLDAEIPPDYLTERFFHEHISAAIATFAPSTDEDLLIFRTMPMRITAMGLVGADANHVRMTLDAGRTKWPSVYWSAAARAGVDFDEGDLVEAVYNIKIDYFRGEARPQLVLLDLKRMRE
jgi:single-stranded-DNA-specific exonuclease